MATIQGRRSVTGEVAGAAAGVQQFADSRESRIVPANWAGTSDEHGTAVVP